MKTPGFLAFAAMLSFTVCVPAFAAVNVEPDYTGTLVVTAPDGEINLYEAGDNLPEISSGSVLEVFDGKFTVTAESGDTVEVSCLEHDASASGPVSLTLTCGETAGNLSVQEGSVVLTQPEGEQVTLQAGDSFDIFFETPVTEAEPTAAGEELGLEAGDLLPGVDSTDIEGAEDSQTSSVSPSF